MADELLLKKIQTSLIVLCCYMYDIVFFIFTHQTEYSNYSITVFKRGWSLGATVYRPASYKFPKNGISGQKM